MAKIVPISFFDPLMRPTKFVGGRVYTIITAEGAYAEPDPDPERGVTVVEKHSDPELGGFASGRPITATLLKNSRNAGEDFATLNATAGKPDGAEIVFGIVVPRTKEVKEKWFEMYVVPLAHAEIPTAPFLWLLSGMVFSEPRMIRFKIRHHAHIIGPGPEGSKPMVQMYPTTASTDNQKGWGVLAYRVDKKGEKQMFEAPPEWYPDIIRPVSGERGLFFGKDPPLIVKDVPFV